MPAAVLFTAVAPVAYAEHRIRRLETLDPVLDSPGGSHVVVDDIFIHYEAAGAGPPVIFIHGFGGSTYSWRRNIDYFARSFRVYAIDLPGFGYSGRTTRPLFGRQAQARIVRGFLEVMGETEPAVLVGHSLGGGVALRYAVDFPAATRALILSAPAVHWNPRWRRAARLFQVPLLGPPIVRSIYYYALAHPRALERMLAGAYGSRLNTVDAEMRESLFRPVRVRGTASSAIGLVRSRDDRPLTELLDRVHAPALVVAGRRDLAIPLHSIERLSEALPDSRVVALDDAGHLVHEEASEEFNREATSFLTRVADPRRMIS
jgi:pimeloyl-ACP methyl ester carboxylesterase